MLMLVMFLHLLELINIKLKMQLHKLHHHTYTHLNRFIRRHLLLFQGALSGLLDVLLRVVVASDRGVIERGNASEINNNSTRSYALHYNNRKERERSFIVLILDQTVLFGSPSQSSLSLT